MNPEVQITSLLLPISPEAPCGPVMRYDPAFTEIRLAREEDDPNLPMRHWERPLKKADWVAIENRCLDLLRNDTKDLQVAAWLLEAWLRQRGLAGLQQGLVLLTQLVLNYWDSVHPTMEDGDADARVAPFEWLNDALPLWLKLHITLVELADRKPPRLNLADWEKMTATELVADPDAEDASSAEPPVEPEFTRTMVIQLASLGSAQQVCTQMALTQACLDAAHDLDVAIRAHLASDAPSLGRITQGLEQLLRVYKQLMPSNMAVETVVQTVVDKATVANSTEMQQTDSTHLPAAGEDNGVLHQVAQTAGWQSREHAYHALEAIADYLGRIEPHSPTPYLIRRAVNWGRMPLPELMAEIMREEGDLNRILNIIGLKPHP